MVSQENLDLINEINESISTKSDFHNCQAFKYYFKSSEYGYKEGNWRVSLSLMFGFGVEIDDQKAHVYIQKSKNKLQIEGILFNGISYLHQFQDRNAYLYIQNASEKNYSTAHICLGFYKFYDILPTEINQDEAQKLILMAGECGDAYCAKFVAKCFQHGCFGSLNDENEQNRFLKIAKKKESFESSLFHPLDFIAGYIGL